MMSDCFVGGTILLVDDEKDVREFLFHSLQQSGYAVVQASSGREALTRFEHFGSEIDVLVTDVVMPGLRGDQLALELLEQKPDLKVVFISGNPVEMLHSAVPLEEGNNFLSKPFGVPDLERVIEGVMA